MKTLGILLVLILSFISCSKTKEEIPGFKTYKDSKYPFSLKYVPKKMQVDTFVSESSNKKAWVSLDADLSDEFPQEIEQGVYMGLYAVKVYTEKGFKDFFRNTDKEQYDESNLNGTPAFIAKNDKGRPWSYILIIPGLYLQVWFSGVDKRSNNPKEISQAESDRFEQLTYEMIKHFKWEQKIDTSSEEFKAWKKHILEILKKEGA